MRGKEQSHPSSSLLLLPMKPRYARIRQGHVIHITRTRISHVKSEVSDTTQYIAHFKVSVHHNLLLCTYCCKNINISREVGRVREREREREAWLTRLVWTSGHAYRNIPSQAPSNLPLMRLEPFIRSTSPWRVIKGLLLPHVLQRLIDIPTSIEQEALLSLWAQFVCKMCWHTVHFKDAKM